MALTLLHWGKQGKKVACIRAGEDGPKGSRLLARLATVMQIDGVRDVMTPGHPASGLLQEGITSPWRRSFK